VFLPTRRIGLPQLRSASGWRLSQRTESSSHEPLEWKQGLCSV